MSEQDKLHVQNIVRYLRQVKTLFFRSSDRIASIYESLPKDVVFSIESNPGVKRAIEQELRSLGGNVYKVISAGQTNEWMLANMKMDSTLKMFTRGRTLPPPLAARWGGKNLEALAGFKSRAEGGMKLSERVWNLVNNAKSIEQQIANAVYEGTSAKRLAMDMKQLLATNYQPGRGVYKSPYKNALRLTRTEVNRAYQYAENIRREQMDFVLGVRVSRSGIPPVYQCDICEAGVGDYPVGYKWDLWHPNCLCYSTDILPSNEVSDKFFEMETEDVNDLRQFDWGDKVQDIPDSMKDFMEDTGFKHYGH